MNYSSGVNNRESHIPFCGNIRRRIQPLPHDRCGAFQILTRFDLAQFRSNVGTSTSFHGAGGMERYIRRENVKHYRELLKMVKTEAERQQILKLLAEEQRKQKDAGDKVEE
jgi:hypothetical protein